MNEHRQDRADEAVERYATICEDALRDEGIDAEPFMAAYVWPLVNASERAGEQR